MTAPLGLYLHIPFCAQKCAYCDFYSLPATAEVKTAYTKLLIRQITELRQRRAPRYDTVYLGGGTPTELGDENLAALLSALRPDMTTGAEVTCEANPASALAPTLQMLASHGVNRLSMGLQSAVPAELAALGRRHTPREFSCAVRAARDAGIARVSADVMLGIPGQTEESLSQTLDFVLSHGIRHVSAYLLKIEPDTPFGKHPPILPDEEETCARYLQTCERLRAAGLERYEISNFALPGEESRHNLRYWQGLEYIGLGPAAHSFLDGKRYYYPRSLTEYLAHPTPVPDGAGGDAQEKLMLALRLADGVAEEDLRALHPAKDPRPLIDALCGVGYLARKGDRVALTDTGCLVSNEIIARLLA